MLIAEQIKKLIMWKRYRIFCFPPELSALHAKATPLGAFFHSGYTHNFCQACIFPAYGRAAFFIFSKSNRRRTALFREEMFI